MSEGKERALGRATAIAVVAGGIVGLVAACNALLGNEAAVVLEGGAETGTDATRTDASRPDSGPADVATTDSTKTDSAMADSKISDSSLPDATDAPETGPPCDGGGHLGDDLNCGRCGHSCLGGACKGKACQPVVLASFDASVVPRFITTDLDGGVYFTTNEAVQWCLTSGCDGGPQQLDSLEGGAGAIAYTPLGYITDPPPGHVFWNTESQIMVARARVPGASIVYTVPGPGPLTGLAVQGDRIYFTSSQEVAGCTFDVPSGCTSPFVTSYHLGQFTWIAVDTSFGYVTGESATGGYVLAFTLSGFSTSLLAVPTGPTGIVVGGGAAYVAGGAEGGISDLLLGDSGFASGASAQPVESTVHAFYLAADATGLYWTGGDGVYFCKLGAACTPLPLAAVPNSSLGIALDSTAVYWTVQSPGEIMKVAKP